MRKKNFDTFATGKRQEDLLDKVVGSTTTKSEIEKILEIFESNYGYLRISPKKFKSSEFEHMIKTLRVELPKVLSSAKAQSVENLPAMQYEYMPEDSNAFSEEWDFVRARNMLRKRIREQLKGK